LYNKIRLSEPEPGANHDSKNKNRNRRSRSHRRDMQSRGASRPARTRRRYLLPAAHGAVTRTPPALFLSPIAFKQLPPTSDGTANVRIPPEQTKLLRNFFGKNLMKIVLTKKKEAETRRKRGRRGGKAMKTHWGNREKNGRERKGRGREKWTA